MDYKCDSCGIEKEMAFMPYGWATIHEEAAGVHDSAAVTFKRDYIRCGSCRKEIKQLQAEVVKYRKLRDTVSGIIEAVYDDRKIKPITIAKWLQEACRKEKYER